MASITFIAPATVVAITGRVKQLREVSVANSSAATYKVCLPSLLSSKRVERIPWFDGTASSNYSCGDRSGLVKVSEGGSISVPHGWSLDKEWVSLQRLHRAAAAGAIDHAEREKEIREWRV